ncbi:MAG TPA: hypothetical protein VJH20_01610 [Candidatus Nanoarchaeia archaeon]|nr:hypothetical protein [Candidatus Nanoarchaeia archaeon]
MAILLQYFLIVLVGFIISTVILKFFVIPVFDLYEHTNFMIWIFLISLSAVFFLPKIVFTGYENPTLSCDCLGFKNTQEKDLQKQIKCLGFIHQCQDITTFRSMAIDDNDLCMKSDFYKDPDSCFLVIAKESIQIDSKNKARSTQICNRIINSQKKNECLDFVRKINLGNTVF